MAKATLKNKKTAKKETVSKGRGFTKPKVSDVNDPILESVEEVVEPIKLAEENVEKSAELSEEKTNKKEKYFQMVGRRKESVAIIRLFTKKSTDAIEGDHALIRVNDKDYRQYFSDKILQGVVESPLRKLKSLNRFKATVITHGGGLSGQADAIKHGLSRALVEFDQNFRKKLKKAKFLTRDSRIKERRKYGLKKARKAPAWSKR